MEYDIIQMIATALVDGVHTKVPIFDDSGAQIVLYLIDGVAYVENPLLYKKLAKIDFLLEFKKQIMCKLI